MILYTCKKRKLLIVGTTTKASKILKNNFEDFNLDKIADNITPGYGKPLFDFSSFGINRQITATQFFKEFVENEV